MTAVKRADERARDDAERFARGEPLWPATPAPPLPSPRRTLAIGDPQAPLATFLSILDVHGALGDDGRLSPSVSLISMGDHFDWGDPADRARAAGDAQALLAWLASHPPEQVTILAGNHDLARVGELHGVDDATFASAQALADQAYYQDDDDALVRFRTEHPGFATEEVVARDLSTFRAVQRDLVEHLLRSRRMQLALATEGMLFVHAGITALELTALGLVGARPPAAHEVAQALNTALAAALAQRQQQGGPLLIEGIHHPGNAEREGRGALYHRPTRGLNDEERDELAQTPPRRRFAIDTLPRGLTQVIGHIRDSKCRRLLADIADAHAADDGPLRTLIVGDTSRYARGVHAAEPHEARIIFLDNGMSHVHARPADYQLFHVERGAPAERG